MKSITSYLSVMFMIMFWGFRMIVAACDNIGIEFITKPMDLNFEIILLFLTLVALILVIKRSILGGVIYLIGNGLYFGTILINLLTGTNTINYTDLAFAILGIALPVFVLLDIILDKNRKEHPVDKKTDWFYKNKDFDRQLDERADKNQYKF